MFSRRAVERWLLLLKVLVVFLVAVAFFAFIFPSNNASFAEAYFAWAKKLAIGIPVWFVVEFVGTKFLGLTFFARLSSSARIAAVTAIAVLVIFVFIFGVSFVKHGYSL